MKRLRSASLGKLRKAGSKSANKSMFSPCGYSSRFSRAIDSGASPLSSNRQSIMPGRNQMGSICRAFCGKATRIA